MGECGDDACGSSPLARGLPSGMVSVVSSSGIIPARAGFTCAPGASSMSPRDHPRSRGVYTYAMGSGPLAYGSSPLARGLRPVPMPVDPVWRIIPARAGFTRHAQVGQLCPQDHPRSRGVYRARMVRSVTSHRIIPARAGFTDAGHGCDAVQWDHPRSRGVYPPLELALISAHGSSPLARGLPDGESADAVVGGIIPARAGFTSRWLWLVR